ncbi:hypothetical protein NV379_19385 [Paenibacillus sp. N1-5-1-14]|uniref:hypothetical protein n=1 Tax=Paenibacillus radicibacter TaxID=2972488 RepID=UPI0021597A2C|nr:hypothetical protein [Paenibacillus radicibacter]MCR8644819.1 hypothetical protein [Paenibacillus radicibacter]
MNTPINASTDVLQARSAPQTKVKKNTYRKLFIAWLILIVLGGGTTFLYTNYLKKQIASDIAHQTEQQLLVVQQDYQKQVTDLKETVKADMAQMQAKVDTLNELLAFTKDSANSKTDNSNQLYTQLAEVKKQLEELQQNLEVLK